MVVPGTNLEQARTWNRRVVLDAVRRHGRLSRAEIARLTGLSAQTVSNIADELRAAGLLRDEGRRRTGRGQPPVDLALAPNGAFTVGLQLDHRALVGVLTNLAGDGIASVEEPVDAPRPEVAVPRMAAAVDRLVRRAGIDRDRLWGVGVVLPGPFGDIARDDPTRLPGWDGFPLSAALGERLGLPVMVENDATAAAIGERLYGAARELSDFIYLWFGTGLGAGIFVGGQPYRGAAGNAGEVGHLPIEVDGIPCACGNRGCLERYVSLHAAYAHLAAAGVEAASPADLAGRRAARHPAVLDWIATAAPRLRRALVILENLFDPDALVVGGLLPDPVLDALLAATEPLLPAVGPAHARTVPRLIRGTAGSTSPALGGAALPTFAGLVPSVALLHQETARPAAPVLQP
jgi:predicted NBD/HSP70 family sugar kinase